MIPSLPNNPSHPVNNRVIVTISDLRTLRPKLDDVCGSLPKRFRTLLDDVLFGPDGNYVWDTKTPRTVREHAKEVMTYIADYWENTFYDHTYSSYDSAVSAVYTEVYDYVEYLTITMTNRVYSFLQHPVDYYGYVVTSYNVHTNYIIINFEEIKTE